MNNNPERLSHRGLRVGFLVQRASLDPLTAPEGELLAIHRESSLGYFRYLIAWQYSDKLEELAPRSIAQTRRGDFPSWASTEAMAKSWCEGDPHFWVLFHRIKKDKGSCLFCGQMRAVVAKYNRGECRGHTPVKLYMSESKILPS